MSEPPPDLKGIIDRTAGFVAKNGPAFEEKIKREQGDKPKFSFLFPEDLFNAYYQNKVRELRDNLLGNINQSSQQHAKDDNHHPDQARNEAQDDQPSRHGATPDQEDSINDHDAAGKSSPVDRDDISNAYDNSEGGPRVKLKLDEYIQEMTMKLEEPPPLNFLATSAPALTHLDNDVIKLTARFIATYGRSFILELASKEQNNSLFDFMKPQHGQFSYMTNLIMQYALIRNPPLDICNQLEKDASSQKHVIDKLRMRAEWEKMLEYERRKKEEQEEKERLLYSQIDWHDFVIVETIDYPRHEKGEYPPTTADQVGTRLLMQQRLEQQNNPPEAADMDMDMDMDSESEDDDDVDQPDDDVEKDDKFAKPNDVVIRKDYDPKAANKSLPDNYFVSPITNERISADSISEHVRFNLADPKYLEKKDQRLQEKINEENVFATGSQMQDSLKSLAERRTDIFGADDLETTIGHRIGDEEDGDKTESKERRVLWDGHMSSLKKKKLG